MAHAALLRRLLRVVHPDVVPAAFRKHNESALQHVLALANGQPKPVAAISFHLRDGGKAHAVVDRLSLAAGLRAMLVQGASPLAFNG